MKDQLISFETAVLSEEKGFDWRPLNYTYKNDGFLQRYENTHLGIPHYPVPTQSLLQRWLREVHQIHIQVKRECIGSDEWEFSYLIDYLPKDFWNYKRRATHFEYIESFSMSGGATYSGAWSTYEECLEKALFHALKLI